MEGSKGIDYLGNFGAMFADRQDSLGTRHGLMPDNRERGYILAM